MRWTLQTNNPTATVKNFLYMLSIFLSFADMQGLIVTAQWDKLEILLPKFKSLAEEGSIDCVHPFTSLLLGISPESVTRIARDYSLKIESKVSSSFSWTLREAEKRRGIESRIKLGFVSPDFNGHAQTLQLLSFFRCFDKKTFQLVCFSTKRPTSEEGRRGEKKLKEQFDEWHYVDSLSDTEASNFIYKQKIDILFDMVRKKDFVGTFVLTFL